MICHDFSRPGLSITWIILAGCSRPVISVKSGCICSENQFFRSDSRILHTLQQYFIRYRTGLNKNITMPCRNYQCMLCIGAIIEKSLYSGMPYNQRNVRILFRNIINQYWIAKIRLSPCSSPNNIPLLIFLQRHFKMRCWTGVKQARRVMFGQNIKNRTQSAPNLRPVCHMAQSSKC